MEPLDGVFVVEAFGAFPWLRPDCAKTTVARLTASKRTTISKQILRERRGEGACCLMRWPLSPSARLVFSESTRPILSMLVRPEGYAGRVFYARACDLVPRAVPAKRKLDSPAESF